MGFPDPFLAHLVVADGGSGVVGPGRGWSGVEGRRTEGAKASRCSVVKPAASGLDREGRESQQQSGQGRGTRETPYRAAP